ncbi:hypothetical protein [Luteimonas sp. e5]
MPASDESRLTTVALDFGEMMLDDGDVLRLYGVPGQGRFEFIWPLISDGAIGALFFLDARHPTPLQVLDEYLASFAETIRNVTSVLVVTHGDEASHDFDTLKLTRHLRSKGIDMAIVQIDPRQRADVLYALNLLLESMPESVAEASHAL